MIQAFIGVGSNVDATRHIPRALSALRETFGALQQSTAYRNPAVGFDGAPFVNLVVGIETGWRLPDVLGRLVGVEARGVVLHRADEDRQHADPR